MTNATLSPEKGNGQPPAPVQERHSAPPRIAQPAPAMEDRMCQQVRVYDDFNDSERVKNGESGVIGPIMWIPVEYVAEVKTAMDNEFKGKRGVKGSTREGGEEMQPMSKNATATEYLTEFRAKVDAYLQQKGM